MRVLGVVLAGGLSTRFGSDKALAMLDGLTLLDRAVAALAPHCDAVAVVGRAVDGIASIADWPRPGMGPLGGIAGGLGHAAAHGFDRLLTIPVDCVQLPAELRALLEPAPSYLEAQPVIGLWPVATAEALRARLTDGSDLAVRAYAREIGARAVRGDFMLPNINRVDDLDRLQRPPTGAA